MKTSTPLRVIVFVRDGLFEAWEAETLRKVMRLGFVEIALLVADASPPAEPKSFIQRVLHYKWNRLFWNRWFRKYGKVNANAPIDMSSELKDIPVYKVQPELRGKYSQHFNIRDIEKIKAHNPDVIIRFGFNILRGEVLTIAKHGVWSFHHADHRVIRGGPAGFWEYILGHRTTGAILQRLTDKLDDGLILRSGYYELVRHSFRENLNTILESTTGWIANALTEIHLNGEVSGQRNNPASAIKAPVFSYPGNFRMVIFWSILIRNKLIFHWNNLFCAETWMIGIVDQSISDVLLKGIHKTPEWIRAKSSEQYLADPFASDLNGETVILAEEYSYSTGLGKIVNTRSGATVLERNFHLSFPFPVSLNGQQFLLAEASASNKLQLFPLVNSVEDITLLHEPVVDPILFHHDERWWLFCHKANDQNNAALFIYYSDTIVGEYFPHALNPVKTDICNSRPAGPIVTCNGKLLRPAQDSGSGYGSRVVVNEITVLTTEQFEEQPINYIAPAENWEYNRGLHTVSPLGESQTLIDAKAYHFNFANFKAELFRKTRRIAGR